MSELEFKLAELENKTKFLNEDLLDQLREIIDNRTQFIDIKEKLLSEFKLVESELTSSLVEVIRTVGNRISNLEQQKKEQEAEKQFSSKN